MSNATPTLDELASDPARALALSPDAALDLLARWSSVERNLIVAAARRPYAEASIESAGDIEVDAKEAAKRLGIAPQTFYRRMSGYPFLRREGRKVLCSLRGIDRWKRERRGA